MSTSRRVHALSFVFAALAGASARAQVSFRELPGSLGTQSGTSLAAPGDLDHDGVPDLVVGAWSHANGPVGTAQLGSLTAYSMRTGAVIWTAHGDQIGERFAFRMFEAGDVDFDGTTDLLVGAGTYAPSAALPQAGRVSMFSGATGARLWHVDGTRVNATIGELFRFAVVGDIDRDGAADVAIGDTHANAFGYMTGEVLVHSGATGALLRTFTGQAAEEAVGYSPCDAGDVDGDGVPDLIVPAMLADVNGVNSGLIRIYSGASSQLLQEWPGGGPLAQFGWLTLNLGDLDLDGRNEIGTEIRANGYRLGLRVYSGATLQPKFMIPNTIGLLYSACGDVNGDGHPDIAATELKFELGVYFYSGVDGSLISHMQSATPGDWFGCGVATLGDLNHDGRADIAIGSPRSVVANELSGKVGVYLMGWEPVERFCGVTPNSLGHEPLIEIVGTPSLSIGGPITLHATNVRNRQLGALIWSDGPMSAPLFAGQCVGAPFMRTRAQRSGGSAAPIVDDSGHYSFAFDAEYLERMGLAPGQRVYAQFVQNDPGSASGTSATSGVAFTIVP